MSFPESLHPYAINTDDTQSYSDLTPGVEALLVTFNASTKVEDGFDFIHVMDGSNEEIAASPFTGTTLAGKSVRVPGNTVKIRLTSDSSITFYGYSIDSITATADQSPVTPSLIITGDDNVAHPSSDGNTGPFEWAGALYVVVRREDIARFNSATIPFEYIAVMKSTDGGLTWTEQDSASSPGINFNYSIFYPRSGGSVLYLAYQSGNSGTHEATTLALAHFDMSTDSYTAIASTAIGSGGVDPTILMVRTSGGVFVLQYKGISGDSKAHGITWSSGSGWSSAVDLSPGVGQPDRIGITDADTVHLLWYNLDAFSRPNVEMDSIWTSGGGFASAITAWTGRRFDQKQNFSAGANLQGKYIASTDEIVFALPNVVVGPAVMFIGTPNGTPTFTRTTVWFTPGTIANQSMWVDIVVSPDESLLTLLFSWVVLDESHHQLLYCTAPATSGPWELPRLYWDEEDTPPVPTPPIFSIDTVSARYVDGGSTLGVVAGAWSFQGGDNQCEVQYYLSMGTTPPSSGRVNVAGYIGQSAFSISGAGRSTAIAI